MLHVCLTLCLLFKAVTSQIISHGNTTAEYGGDAYYSCVVGDPKGVRQITWQRLFSDDSIENLATYSSRFGQQVNEPFVKKVVIRERSLSSMSITVRNVVWGDESCYICLFNTFPDGSKSSQTCLTVTGMSKVHTSHEIVESAEEHPKKVVVLHCSATGKPTPTIQWDVYPRTATFKQTPTIVMANSDHTVTTSSGITLTAPAGWEGNVDCVLNNGTEHRRTERIPLSLPNDETHMGIKVSHFGVVLSVCLVFSLFIAAAVMSKSKMSTCSRGKTEAGSGTV